MGAHNERVTVTLPDAVVRHIDRLETNRSRFILEAVRHELLLRRREELRRSLRNPHPDGSELADSGLEEWSESLPAEEAGLLDPRIGQSVRWVPGEGWIEVSA